MEILLKLACAECERSVIVIDDDVEEDEITCPHCNAAIAIPTDDDEDQE